MEAHLGSNIGQPSGPEVVSPHPALDRTERMLDEAAPGPHGVGHAVEPGLHPVEHVLILPAPDAPQLGRRALGSERTGEASAQVAIEVEVFGVIRTAIGLGEFGLRRTSVMVLFGVVDEVLLTETPIRLRS